jgi:hypothetical protein
MIWLLEAEAEAKLRKQAQRQLLGNSYFLLGSSKVRKSLCPICSNGLMLAGCFQRKSLYSKG